MHPWAKGKERMPGKYIKQGKLCKECYASDGGCTKTAQKCARCWWKALPCTHVQKRPLRTQRDRLLTAVLNTPRPRVMPGAVPVPPVLSRTRFRKRGRGARWTA